MSHYSRARKDTIPSNDRRTGSPLTSDNLLIQRTFLEAALAYVAAGGEKRYLIDTPLLARLGSKRVSDFDLALIETMARELWPHGTPGTRKRKCYTPISAVLHFAAERGWCRHWKIARPKEAKRETPLPSVAQLNSFIRSCAHHAREIVLFIARTGANLRQILEIEWSHVDLDKQVAYVKDANGAVSLLQLDDVVMYGLERLENRSGGVFLNHCGNPYRRKSDGGGHLKTALRNAAKRAGVPHIGPRLLRKIWIMRNEVGWIGVETAAELERSKRRISTRPVMTKSCGSDSHA